MEGTGDSPYSRPGERLGKLSLLEGEGNIAPCPLQNASNHICRAAQTVGDCVGVIDGHEKGIDVFHHAQHVLATLAVSVPDYIEDVARAFLPRPPRDRSNKRQAQCPGHRRAGIGLPLITEYTMLASANSFCASCTYPAQYIPGGLAGRSAWQ